MAMPQSRALKARTTTEVAQPVVCSVTYPEVVSKAGIPNAAFSAKVARIRSLEIGASAYHPKSWSIHWHVCAWKLETKTETELLEAGDVGQETGFRPSLAIITSWPCRSRTCRFMDSHRWMELSLEEHDLTAELRVKEAAYSVGRQALSGSEEYCSFLALSPNVSPSRAGAYKDVKTPLAAVPRKTLFAGKRPHVAAPDRLTPGYLREPSCNYAAVQFCQPSPDRSINERTCSQKFSMYSSFLIPLPHVWILSSNTPQTLLFSCYVPRGSSTSTMA